MDDRVTNALTETVSNQGLITFGLAALIVVAICSTLVFSLRMWLRFIERMLDAGKINTTRNSTELVRTIGTAFPLKALQAGLRPRLGSLPRLRKGSPGAVAPEQQDNSAESAS